MEVFLDGKKIENIESLNVSTSFEAIAGKFTLTSSFDKKKSDINLFDLYDGLNSKKIISKYPRVPIFGKSIQIKIDGASILDGYIFDNRITMNNSGIKITAEGFDKTADLVHNRMGNSSFNGGVKLESLIKRVLNRFDISGVKVIPLKKTSKFSDDEVLDPKVDEVAFDFLKKYASLKYVFLTTDGSGNIIIRDGKPLLIHDLYDNALNLEYSVMTSDNYNTFEVFSQSNSYDSFSGTSKDNEIRNSRYFSSIANENLESKSEANVKARWVKVIKQSRSSEYKFTLSGYSLPLKGTKTNKTLKVGNSIFLTNTNLGLIQKEVFIKEINYTFDRGGKKMDVTCCKKGAFTL